jgi:hypothetical protein
MGVGINVCERIKFIGYYILVGGYFYGVSSLFY